MPEDWSRWRDVWQVGDYDRRWARMAAAGQNPHGEADFVCRYSPSRVLDAGCGTGRVGIELARRGIAVAGVDADRDMVAAARTKAPDLPWECVDLALFESPDRYDVVVLAGNVIPYVAAGSRAGAVAACARALVPGGRLVAGFSLRPGWPSLQDYDGWCADAGLVVEDRYATWDGDPYAGGDYLLAVHRSPADG